MPQVSHIDIEVRPSQNYQTVGFTSRLVFDPAVSLEEAMFEADLAYSDLEAVALKRVAQLSELRGDLVPSSPASIAPPVASSNGFAWQIGQKPNSAGTFKYLPTSVVSREEFISKATGCLAELGINPSDVNIYDDRTGDRGLESGGQSYTAGKVKVKPDTTLAEMMQGKTILAGVDFTDNGGVKVVPSREGKTALAAQKIAGQFANLEATPF
jgi:hypothetical protein